MRIFGIDPGIAGAIAVLDDKKIVDVKDLPTMSEGKKNKRQLNSANLSQYISSNIVDFNKTVVFTTDGKSLHGHPQPMKLPKGRSRNSIALYYYVAYNPADIESRKREMTQYFRADGSRYPDLKVQ